MPSNCAPKGARNDLGVRFSINISLLRSEPQHPHQPDPRQYRVRGRVVGNGFG